MSDKPLEIQELCDNFWEEKSRSRKERYQIELTKYLTSKLEPYNIPTHTILEIVQYAIVGTMLVVSDELENQMRMTKNIMRERRERNER